MISSAIARLATLSFLVLAACGAPQSANRGPGAGLEVPSVQTAAALFRKVCLDTGAREAGIRIAAGDAPYLLNFDQDIYYHQRYNLSFKPGIWDGDPACSMVTATFQPDQMRAALSRAARSRGFAVMTRLPTGITAPEGVYVNAVVVRR
jgi:hypothetical protein